MAATPWEGDLPKALADEFGEKISAFSSYLGQNFLVCQPGEVRPILTSLRDNHEFAYLVDVTAVHFPDKPAPFEVVYILYSFERNERIRVKTQVKADEKLASAVPVFITADWLEREVYDMFGVEFEGHPGLKRILMPEDWETFPLRKENNILKMDQRWVQENLGIESGQ
ncbi:MAG: NADH-quinone oxidoreductase subunit C [Acidobacteria bacterium]|nr:NADH-quinone oxidoreductase subunit C [Acidobacteriota bacterium]